jgi:hypothetical protein
MRRGASSLAKPPALARLARARKIRAHGSLARRAAAGRRGRRGLSEGLPASRGSGGPVASEWPAQCAPAASSDATRKRAAPPTSRGPKGAAPGSRVGPAVGQPRRAPGPAHRLSGTCHLVSLLKTERPNLPSRFKVGRLGRWALRQAARAARPAPGRAPLATRLG